MAAQRMGPFGSKTGGHFPFNDVNFHGVTRLTIGLTDDRKIQSIKLFYRRNGDANDHEVIHGEEPNATIEYGPFDVQHGFIKTVGGTYQSATSNGSVDSRANDILLPTTGFISTLFFITTRGEKSQVFGAKTRDKNEVKFEMTGANRTQLVGLYGRFGHELITIGAIFAEPNL